MSGSKKKTDNTSKFYEKVEGEYLLDLQGIETHVELIQIGMMRYIKDPLFLIILHLKIIT